MRPETARREARGLPPVVRASRRRGLRARLAWWLRCAADRIDYEGSFRCASPYTFTFEQGEGIRWREDGHGTPVWYWNPERGRAHEEADGRPPNVDDVVREWNTALDGAFRAVAAAFNRMTTPEGRRNERR